jgi:RNase P subunit RPR2
MICKKCNKELIEGIIEFDPTKPKYIKDDKTIIKCPNCDTIIENYLMVIKDFSKNNLGKTFKVIMKLTNPMEAQ